MKNLEVRKPIMSGVDGESAKRLMERTRLLESIFEIGRVGPKMVNKQEYVTVESLWENEQISVFVPKNLALVEEGKPTKIVTGACMFGGNWGIQIATETGKKISLSSPRSLRAIDPTHDRAKSLVVDPQIHPAEAENTYRLVKGLSFLTKNHSGPPLSISFHIPELEYMLYALDLVKNGIMNVDLFLETCSAISDRSAMLRQMYKKRLSGQEAKINFIAPLQGIGEAISKPTQDLQPIGLFALAEDEVVDRVRNSGWKPNSFSEIAFLSYSIAYWQHYLQTKLDGANPLAVETIEETKIFLEAKKLRNVFKGEQLGVFPIYLPPEVVSEQGEDLYWMHKPNQMVPILKFIAGVFK